ncbi:hypothetical protein ACQKL5_10780 [Peribacillus sp. NPDC097675]|uniref:hypothetical protein n=1 Tax=Peribacillus sp. NPDC097675 TaxID=3390618 RepID=UPI003D054900
MSKNMIVVKKIMNQKSLIPFIIGISLLMILIHNKITLLWVVFTFWAISIAAFILYLNNKKRIIARFKIRTVVEAIILLIFYYLIAFVPNSLVVFIGVTLSLFYLVSLLTEDKSKSSLLVKSTNSYKKISDEERLGFNSRQKLNYTLPNSEIELAIIDGEAKLAELINKQKSLSEIITIKESDIAEMESNLKNSKSFQYVNKLKQALRQVLTERDELVIERDRIQKEKEAILDKLHIKGKELESQTEANNALFSDKQFLLEKVEENERDLFQKQQEMNHALKEREQLNIQLQFNKKEINELRTKKEKLEELEIKNKQLLVEQENNKNNILIITKKLEESISLRKQSEEELEKIETQHNKLINEFENIKLQSGRELKEYRKQYNGLEKDFVSLKEKLADAEIERMNYQKQLENNIQKAAQLNNELKQTKKFSKEQEKKLVNELNNLLLEQENFEKILEEKFSVESQLKSEIEQKNFNYNQIKDKYNDLKNNSEEQLTFLTKEKEQLVVFEQQLKQEIQEFEEIQHNNEKLKNSLITQNKEYKEQINKKDQEISHYLNEINKKEKAQENLRELLKQNKDKIEHQESHITQLKVIYENDKAEIQKKEMELVKQQAMLQKNKEELNLLQFDLKTKEESINRLKDELNKKQENLRKVEKASEEKELEVLERKEELEKLKIERNHLKKENENHIDNIKRFYTDDDRNLYEQEFIQDEKILDDETIRKSPFEKRRFKILYPQLEFEDKFFGDYKKLEENDKIHLEKQLLILCYKGEQVHFRPDAPTKTREIRFKRDQKGIGKGRIYITSDGKKVLGFSIDEKDQRRKIPQLS